MLVIFAGADQNTCLTNVSVGHSSGTTDETLQGVSDEELPSVLQTLEELGGPDGFLKSLESVDEDDSSSGFNGVAYITATAKATVNMPNLTTAKFNLRTTSHRTDPDPASASGLGTGSALPTVEGILTYESYEKLMSAANTVNVRVTRVRVILEFTIGSELVGRFKGPKQGTAVFSGKGTCKWVKRE
jgi:hypothetical protein